MKKLMLSLLFAAAASIPVSAMAIVPEAPYAATITTGALPPNDVGVLIFSLLGDMPGTACVYDVEWFNKWNGLSTELVIDDMKSQGNLSCIPSIAQLASNSVLMLDTHFGLGGTNLGFNRFNVPTPVCMLVLGETGGGNAFGLIQFGPSASAIVLPTFVNGFMLHLATT